MARKKKKKAQKRQQIRAKRAAKSKQRAKKIPSFSLFKKAPSLNQTSQWPLMECLISESWQDPTQLTQIIVARQNNEGYVAIGAYLIDQACLGAKNAMTATFASVGEYRREYRRKLLDSQDFIEIDLNLAAKVIDESVKYAQSLGLKPHKDLRKAMKMLGDARPEDAPETVPLSGEDNRPLFIAGPYDNATRILKILDRNVGPGNYDFILPVDESAEFYRAGDVGDFEEFDEL